MERKPLMYRVDVMIRDEIETDTLIFFQSLRALSEIYIRFTPLYSHHEHGWM